MVLVGYSDSEGSDTEPTPVPTTRPAQPAKPTTTTNFAVDKADPKKIRVNLTESSATTTPTDDIDGEPPAKRARVGAGAFSGFNAMLPAPKRANPTTSSASANTNTNGTKAPARKVFSLKTGAEPAFSRDSDSELRELFADDGARRSEESTIPASIPKPAFIAERQQSAGAGSDVGGGKPFMFKPLSVARNSKKKKSPSTLATPVASTTQADQTPIQPSAASPIPSDQQAAVPRPAPKKEKISLFSSGPAALPPDPEDLPANDNDTLNHDASSEDEILELLDDNNTQPTTTPTAPAETLSSIATSLNLSAAERRQLLGRNHTHPHNTNPNSSKNPTTANRIINFNTDAEYIANQQLNAAEQAQQLQHNPVRAIAPGKHSLKSLVASAQGQKDALEESFARGKGNKREAGSRYGW